MVEEPDARWMTYRELAAARAISPASATRLAMRRKWRRQRGNDGIARVLVPMTEAEPARATASDVMGVIAGDVSHDATPDIARTINALEEHVITLRERLAEAEQRIAREATRADQAEAEVRAEREAARRLAEQIAELGSAVARLAAAPAGESTPPGRWRRWLAAWLGRG
jgi:hypothetical protein